MSSPFVDTTGMWLISLLFIPSPYVATPVSLRQQVSAAFVNLLFTHSARTRFHEKSVLALSAICMQSVWILFTVLSGINATQTKTVLYVGRLCTPGHATIKMVQVQPRVWWCGFCICAVTKGLCMWKLVADKRKSLWVCGGVPFWDHPLPSQWSCIFFTIWIVHFSPNCALGTLQAI